MGQILLASCECGFVQRVATGIGMAGDAAGAPALCTHCSSMVTLEESAAPGLCPRCGQAGVTPYGDPRLRDNEVRPIHGILQFKTFDAYAAYMADLMDYTPESLAEIALRMDDMLAQWRAEYEAVWHKVARGEYRPLECYTHVCPSCRKTSLTFDWAGTWD